MPGLLLRHYGYEYSQALRDEYWGQQLSSRRAMSLAPKASGLYLFMPTRHKTIISKNHPQTTKPGNLKHMSSIKTEAPVTETSPDPQRAQYPLIKEYTLNYKGIHTMIFKLYSLIRRYRALWALRPDGSVAGVAQSREPLDPARSKSSTTRAPKKRISKNNDSDIPYTHPPIR